MRACDAERERVVVRRALADEELLAAPREERAERGASALRALRPRGGGAGGARRERDVSRGCPSGLQEHVLDCEESARRRHGARGRLDGLELSVGVLEPLLRDARAEPEALGALEHRGDLILGALRRVERHLELHGAPRRPVGDDELLRAAGGARGLRDEPLRLLRDAVGLPDLVEVTANGLAPPLDALRRALEDARDLEPPCLDHVRGDRPGDRRAALLEIGARGVVQRDERCRARPRGLVGHDDAAVVRAHDAGRLVLIDERLVATERDEASADERVLASALPDDAGR